ncbi:acyltransferase [Roseibium sp.]|uniref:acyltransferase n=1 Tax=Roseibium sp. TaxID=1936156 RepID=UPI003BACDAF3
MKYPIHKVRNNLYHYRTLLLSMLYRNLYGMKIGSNTRISVHAKLDKTNPKGINIGSHTQITFGVAVLTHDFVNRLHLDTYIGDYTFIGANSVILPGVRVGNHCIVGTGSIVTKDIPDHSVAVGNPARVVKTGIQTGEYGVLISPDQQANSRSTEEKQDDFNENE